MRHNYAVRYLLYSVCSQNLSQIGVFFCVFTKGIDQIVLFASASVTLSKAGCKAVLRSQIM